MIRIENVSKIYKMGDLELAALDNVSLEIKAGEFVAIMGPSGSGKSTLMNMIGFLDEPTSGNYIIDGKDTSGLSATELAGLRNNRIGFVFQSFNLLSDMSARDNVELPLIYSNNKNRKEKAEASLKRVGLGKRVHHKPKELSGGQQQRVAIARALVNDPSIIMADEPTGALDTQTGEEIMQLLVDLNKSGITVIVVTHDPEVAQYASRVIMLRDGKIEKDDRNYDTNESGSFKKDDFKKSNFLNFAEIFESLSMAFKSIISNKMRSFLTTLGIIIGVASVIAMTSIGTGASKQITDRISNMGANLLMIQPGQSNRTGVVSTSFAPLTYEDGQAVAEESNYVEAVDAQMSKRFIVIYKDKNYRTEVMGTTTSFLKVMNFNIDYGRFFTEDENIAKRRVAVIGNTILTELFEGKDPIGEYIKINNSQYQVIGVLEEKGGSGWRDQDDVIVVPLFTAQTRLIGKDVISNLNVTITSNDIAEKAEAEITGILRKRHGLRDGDLDDFRIRSQAEILDTVSETTQSFTFLLAGIAVVSLVVGGIGIMNIMLVSVAERTREIGIRKAIGARGVDILTQFLIEAILVSVSGGILGIGFGYSIGRVVSHFAGWPTIVTMQSVLVSFFFSMAVGLFFGFYPARKASKMNPIDALRYE
ncbi:MAG: MacB family efflux pump subunit [Candidatus Muiribacterium halophilum]|uniref:MacB family efflux pump subunit n=1 Tax=Muiribacterium halophilum TaxID=2053465 RepID=A0A2N5ZN96_MUIH1|nr:MAG: MacB family efflux pump subunit [Candidatus Muirbacterium halophilum]